MVLSFELEFYNLAKINIRLQTSNLNLKNIIFHTGSSHFFLVDPAKEGI